MNKPFILENNLSKVYLVLSYGIGTILPPDISINFTIVELV